MRRWTAWMMVIIGLFVAGSVGLAAAEAEYRGIDVSVYQGDIDFERVKATGVEMVYIRAGEGTNITDEYFEQNYERARAAGLPFGFYYYVTAGSTTEAVAQAERFVALLRGKTYDLRPAMDFEYFGELSTDEINAVGAAFLARLEELTRVTPVLYTDAYNAQNLWSESFRRYPVWIADYSSGETPPTNPVWGSEWSGYQYSDAGQVDGIEGAVDLDKFRDTIRIRETERIRGQLEITKTDAAGTPLAGATFVLKNESGEALRTGVSDANGRVVFDNLPYGRYRWQETAAPAGYQPDTREYTLFVETDGQVIRAVVANEKSPSTGDCRYTVVGMAVLAGVSGWASVYLTAARDRRRER